MERLGRLNIVIGIDSRYCPDCGSPDLEDGCSNSWCRRARANARLPVSLAIRQLAIEATFPSMARKKGIVHTYLGLGRTSDIVAG